MNELIKHLMEKYGLGAVQGEIIPVSGGFMHKMYKVKTLSGTYAVKCLNPDIMKRPGVMENYARAEALEHILEENDVPVVSALSFAGRKMLETDGRFFYVFKWLEGHITDFNDIKEEQCFIAGKILGRIHAIDIVQNGYDTPELSSIDFCSYIKLAREKSSSILSDLEDNLPLLEFAQAPLDKARTLLPNITSIINDDMDPKNVMWSDGRAYVIDLECLDYGNPVASVLNLAMQWAGTVNEKYSCSNLEAFFRGYLSEYDNGFRAYGELYGIVYSWVEWLEYNIRRALGLEGSDDTIIGESEVRNTIARIAYLASLQNGGGPLIFNRRKEVKPEVEYDPDTMIPVIRSSICTGEKVAGFKNKKDGHFTEVMLIVTPGDERHFKDMYGLDTVKTEY